MKTLAHSQFAPNRFTFEKKTLGAQPSAKIDTPKKKEAVQDVMDQEVSNQAPQLPATGEANHPHSLMALRLRSGGDLAALDYDDTKELYQFLMKTGDSELKRLGSRAIDVGEFEIEDHRTRYEELPKKIALNGLASLFLVLTTPVMPLTLLAMPKAFGKTREAIGLAIEGKKPLNLMALPSYREFVEALEASAIKDNSPEKTGAASTGASLENANAK